MTTHVMVGDSAHKQAAVDFLQSIVEGRIREACLEPGDPGYALAHIFGFEGDRVAELWDMA